MNPDVGLVTSTGSGFGGEDESVLQNVTLGMTTLGAAAQYTDAMNFNAMSDDFTLSQETDITYMVFYAYQTGAPTTPSITGVYVRIWDGDPSAMGSTIVWGDMATNVLSSASFSNIYRVAESTMGDNLRAIQRLEVSTVTTLAAGTYWVEVSYQGSASFSGPWAPPLTEVGQNTTGNSLQYFLGSWGPFNDGGSTKRE